MKTHNITSVLLLLALLFSTELRADESIFSSYEQSGSAYFPCEYLQSCCLQQSSWGTLSVFGEYLYWQPVVTGLPYSLTHTILTVPFNPFGPENPFPDNLSDRNVKFGYGNGYRLGASYTVPETDWDFKVDYTQFDKKGRDSVMAGGEVFVDTLWDVLSAVVATEANAEMDVELKITNVTIGKTVPLGGCFKIRPNFGLQFFKLDCNENIQYLGTTFVASIPQASTADIQLINDTNGWGLLAGFDATWELPWCFELFGQTNYGILRTSFSVSQNQQTEVTTQDTIVLTSTTHFTAILQSIQAKGGLGWNYQFQCCNHPFFLKLYAAYEMDLWLQNIQLSRMLSLGTGYSDAITTNIGNVGFRGLSTGVQITF